VVCGLCGRSYRTAYGCDCLEGSSPCVECGDPAWPEDGRPCLCDTCEAAWARERRIAMEEGADKPWRNPPREDGRTWRDEIEKLDESAFMVAAKRVLMREARDGRLDVDAIEARLRSVVAFSDG
jgi:hypothetical protein